MRGRQLGDCGRFCRCQLTSLGVFSLDTFPNRTKSKIRKRRNQHASCFSIFLDFMSCFYGFLLIFCIFLCFMVLFSTEIKLKCAFFREEISSFLIDELLQTRLRRTAVCLTNTSRWCATTTQTELRLARRYKNRLYECHLIAKSRKDTER